MLAPSRRKPEPAQVHLMTTSRDGPGVTRYPGEVRAGELAKVREILAEAAAPEDAILMCGDFNTPPADAHVWRGDVGVGAGTDRSVGPDPTFAKISTVPSRSLSGPDFRQNFDTMFRNTQLEGTVTFGSRPGRRRARHGL